MRVPLKKLMERLGVDRELHPYETQPWYYYDDEQSTTCSAEVRMGPDGKDVEAEIQFFKDDPDDDTDDNGAGGGLRQILFMRAEVTAGEWGPKHLRVKSEDYTNKFHDWEGKGCDFFTACIQSINMGELPDIDMLVEQNMQDDSRTGRGASGRVGRKSPKVKPGALLGLGKKP